MKYIIAVLFTSLALCQIYAEDAKTLKTKLEDLKKRLNDAATANEGQDVFHVVDLAGQIQKKCGKEVYQDAQQMALNYIDYLHNTYDKFMISVSIVNKELSQLDAAKGNQADVDNLAKEVEPIVKKCNDDINTNEKYRKNIVDTITAISKICKHDNDQILDGKIMVNSADSVKMELMDLLKGFDAEFKKSSDLTDKLWASEDKENYCSEKENNEIEMAINTVAEKLSSNTYTIIKFHKSIKPLIDKLDDNPTQKDIDDIQKFIDAFKDILKKSQDINKDAENRIKNIQEKFDSCNNNKHHGNGAALGSSMLQGAFPIMLFIYIYLF